ncbi:glutamic acid-rich protein-like isoform X7 [Plodia interpunctella]|uniref:glutamic acid-rich protein-like isoform X7 n=1 Tax=Plodia interpunctella TaxID=58824 RepID=UPI002367DA4B|nr:glutamic acid-rich protein-like isoform X8 [Plodia interpunctella]
MDYRTAICRLCLVTDEHMFAIGGTPLQIVYEKLTNIQFLDDAKPVVACQICHAQLKKSWKLMVTSLKADNVFTDYMKNNTMIDVKTFSLIDRRAYSLTYPLVSTLVELTDRPPEEYKLEVKKESEVTFFPISETVVLIDSKTDVNVPNVDLEFMKEEVEWMDESAAVDKADTDTDDDIPVKSLVRRESKRQGKRQPAKRTQTKRLQAKRTQAKRQPAKRKPKPKEVTFIEPPKEEEIKEEENQEELKEEEPELKDDGHQEDDDDSDYEPPLITDEGEEDIKPEAKPRKHASDIGWGVHIFKRKGLDKTLNVLVQQPKRTVCRWRDNSDVQSISVQQDIPHQPDNQTVIGNTRSE